ncbi:MAG: hypothetical protein JWO20_1315 [Candidatus Angelobacter sp.]|jgi:hypothetical protein|nr:hypothetical protein [Candidatus Angelobacter sp.]
MLSAVAAGSSGQVKTVKKNSAIPPSHWGGEHAAMEVTADGAQLEFDCAHGQITGPVRLNRNGNFDVAGTFSPEHGGPVLRDEESSTPPARLTGQVKGDTLVLKVIPAGAKEPSGTFTLVKGAEPRLMKCR